jgi:hypothetical protein
MAKTAAAKHASDYRKRQAEQKEALGVETLKVDVPKGVKAGLKRLMKEHGFSQQQEVFQTAILHLISASREDAARILSADTSGFTISPKLAREFYEAHNAKCSQYVTEELGGLNIHNYHVHVLG